MNVFAIEERGFARGILKIKHLSYRMAFIDYELLLIQ